MPSVVLIADDLMQCVRAMFMVAQGSCNGPTCTLECKQALLVAIGTLAGSCCDQLGMGADASQQCHMFNTLVVQMKQVVAEKCPSNFNFNFDFVANGLIDVKVPQMKQVVVEKWPGNFTLTLSPMAP